MQILTVVRWFLPTVIFGTTALPDATATAPAAISQESDVTAYAAYMGWTFSEIRELRMVGIQGALKIMVDSNGTATHWFFSTAGGSALTELTFENGVVTQKRPDGSSFTPPPDVAQEFVSESHLVNNDIVGYPATDDGPVPSSPSLEAVTVRFPQGAPTTLWLERGSGRLLVSIIHLPDRVAQFRPIGIDARPNGKRAIATWKRDQEPLIDFQTIQMTDKSL